MARTRTVAVAAAALAALVLAACGGEPDDPLAETGPATIDDEPEDAPEDEIVEEPQEDDVADPPERVEPDPGDPEERDEGEADGHGVATGLDAEIDAAVEDLSRRADVTADAITVVQAEQVTWRDGSIGCPDPGQMYTMALVEGYRIVLEADGERFDYHGQHGSEPFYCPDPDDPADDGQGRVTR